MHTPLLLPLADVWPRELGQRRWSDGHKFSPELVRPIPLQMRILPWILTQVLKGSAPLISWLQAHCWGGGGGGGDLRGGGGKGGGAGDGGGGDFVVLTTSSSSSSEEAGGGWGVVVVGVAP